MGEETAWKSEDEFYFKRFLPQWEKKRGAGARWIVKYFILSLKLKSAHFKTCNRENVRGKEYPIMREIIIVGILVWILPEIFFYTHTVLYRIFNGFLPVEVMGLSTKISC